MFRESFLENLKSQGLIINKEQLSKFEKYFEFLIEENSKYNLTSITKEDQVYEKHFFDSLSPLFYKDLSNLSILDVGSGAGFPGLPLKIMDPSIKLSILDSNNKKIKFTQKIADFLNLEGINFINKRAEEFNGEKFDVVIARGVAHLSILLELVSELIKKEGILIAYKGSSWQQELLESKNAIKILGYELMYEQSYILQDEGSVRCNLYFKKAKGNDKIYPRAFSKIKAKPL